MEVLINRGVFRDKLIDLRLAQEDTVLHILESHQDGLPLICTLQIGDDAFTVCTTYLVRDTKERFLHSIVTDKEQSGPASDLPHETSEVQMTTNKRMKLSASPGMRQASGLTTAQNRDSKCVMSGGKRVIFIQAIDAPAAKCAFNIFKLEVPTNLQVAELVDLIQTLAFLNAWAALESLAHAMDTTALSNTSLVTALAASAQFTHESPMLLKLASEIDRTERKVMEDEWKHAWESLADFVTIALCQDMKGSSKSSNAQWLWHTLAAILSHSECIEGEVDVPNINNPAVCTGVYYADGQSFRKLQSSFLEQCNSKPLCQCRSGVIETLMKKSHESIIGQCHW